VHESGEETVPEPNTNVVVVFEEIFAAGLQMPPHPTFMKILLKFRASPDPKCYCSDVEVFLGGAELRWRT
jgi:hypothetical protein